MQLKRCWEYCSSCFFLVFDFVSVTDVSCRRICIIVSKGSISCREVEISFIKLHLFIDIRNIRSLIIDTTSYIHISFVEIKSRQSLLEELLGLEIDSESREKIEEMKLLTRSLFVHAFMFKTKIFHRIVLMNPFFFLSKWSSSVSLYAFSNFLLRRKWILDLIYLESESLQME